MGECIYRHLPLVCCKSDQTRHVHSLAGDKDSSGVEKVESGHSSSQVRQTQAAHSAVDMAEMACRSCHLPVHGIGDERETSAFVYLLYPSISPLFHSLFVLFHPHTHLHSSTIDID